MSKKRRRRPPRPPATGSAPPTAEDPTDGAEAFDEAPPDDGAAGPAPSPVPPIGTSLARGMWATAGHPLTLSVAFLSVLATWALYVALGTPPTPGAMAVTMAVSPAHLFADIPLAIGAGDTTVTILAAVLGFAAARAVTFGLLILLQVQALRDGRTDLREAVSRLPRLLPGLIGVYLFEIAAVVFANLVLGSILPGLQTILLAAAIYLLVYLPVVTVAEDRGVQESVRRGFRAIRLPGTRHLALVIGYFIVMVYSFLGSPFGPFPPATPSPLAWGYVLVATFLHVSVLGAFVYRWLEIRDRVPGEPAPRRSR